MRKIREPSHWWILTLLFLTLPEHKDCQPGKYLQQGFLAVMYLADRVAVYCWRQFCWTKQDSPLSPPTRVTLCWIVRLLGRADIKRASDVWTRSASVICVHVIDYAAGVWRKLSLRQRDTAESVSAGSLTFFFSFRLGDPTSGYSVEAGFLLTQ